MGALPSTNINKKRGFAILSSPVKIPEIRRLRCKRMLEMRILGISLQEIGKHFNCTKLSVEKSLDWAIREGLAQDHENSILEFLVPKAIEVYKKKLEAEDAYVAKDVLDKLIKLGDRWEAKEMKSEEISIEMYLQESRKNKQITTTVEPSEVKALTEGEFTFVETEEDIDNA